MATVSIVGAETLLGRELKERLDESGTDAHLQMLGAVETAGILTETEGEATILTPLDAERVRGSEVVVCAADAASARRVFELASGGRGRPGIVDLTGGLEELPNARLRSPLAEAGTEIPASDAIQVVAHPAAAVLAAMLTRVHVKHPILRSVIQVFEPVSERGRAGLTELQQQVSSLLSFRKLDKRVFDAQIGFNLLARYGEDAPEHLEQIEAKIQRHLATLLRGGVPMPSMRLIQAPVFHGHSFSLWTEFESRPSVAELGEALASAQIEVRGMDVEAPSNVGAAGQSGVIAGVIEPDSNHPRAMWVWAVADNFRIAADDAVEIVRSMLGGGRV